MIAHGGYLEATASILQKHNGIWFNDETFVVSRRWPATMAAASSAYGQ